MEVQLYGCDIDLTVEGFVGVRIDEDIGADTKIEAADERMVFRAWRVENSRIVLAEVAAPSEPDGGIVVRLHLAIFELRFEWVVGVIELQSNRHIVPHRVQVGRLDEESVGDQILCTEKRG